MSPGVRILLVLLLLAALAGAVPLPASAQTAPDAPPAAPVDDGTSGASPDGAASGGGGVNILELLRPVVDDLAQSVALKFLVKLGQEIVGGLKTLVAGAIGSSFNIVTQTPPAVSYANPAVQGLAGTTRAIANAALVLVVLWGGINVILREHVGAPYHGAMQLLPRAAMGALLVNTSGWWTQLAVDANNALCAAVGGAGLPGFDQADPAKQVFLELVVAAVYLVTCLLLFLQQLMRLALVDVLLVAAPLGLVCWVLPQTQAWARLWSSTFLAAVFAQFPQVLALRLGASVLASAAPQGADAALTGLLLGIAVVVLTLRIPGFMVLQFGGGLAAGRLNGAGIGAARHAAAAIQAPAAVAGRNLALPGRGR